MIFKNVYIKDEDITRTEYLDSYNSVRFHRVHHSAGCESITIKCIKEEYENEIMFLQRRMESK
jgi:hypothetical protein